MMNSRVSAGSRRSPKVCSIFRHTSSTSPPQLAARPCITWTNVQRSGDASTLMTPLAGYCAAYTLAKPPDWEWPARTGVAIPASPAASWMRPTIRSMVWGSWSGESPCPGRSRFSTCRPGSIRPRWPRTGCQISRPYVSPLSRTSGGRPSGLPYRSPARPATLIRAGATGWVTALVAPLFMVASLCWLSRRRRSARPNDSFARSQAPARRAARGRVVAAFQPGADGCLQVRACLRCCGPDVADHGAQRPGHVHPGPFGLIGGAAGTAAQSGCPAQLGEQPLALGLGRVQFGGELAEALPVGRRGGGVEDRRRGRYPQARAACGQVEGGDAAPRRGEQRAELPDAAAVRQPGVFRPGPEQPAVPIGPQAPLIGCGGQAADQRRQPQLTGEAAASPEQVRRPAGVAVAAAARQRLAELHQAAGQRRAGTDAFGQPDRVLEVRHCVVRPAQPGGEEPQVMGCRAVDRIRPAPDDQA